MKTRLRRVLERLSGPVLSLALHVAILVALMSFVAFKPKVEEDVIETTLLDTLSLTLDPLDPPTLKPPVENPSEVPNEAPDLPMEMPDVATPELADAAVDVDLSPLAPVGIAIDLGRDRKTLGALTTAYGDRAAKNGLYGSYFNRIDFSGETFTRIDETLNKQWELESPWPGKIRADRFSVIWTGRIVPKRTGTYTLYLQSDDGARLWINGQLVLDQFVERERAVNEVKLKMLAGLSYDIKYVFCDVFQHAISRLEWSAEDAGIPRELIPKDCLWADGPSTAEMMRWNETRAVSGAPSYANRSRMKNPAEIEGFPLSHIVNYDALSPDELRRLDLADLLPEFHRAARNGALPTITVTPVTEITPMRADQPKPREGDVTIEIL